MDKLLIMMGLLLALSGCSDIPKETYVAIVNNGTEIRTDHETIDGLINGRMGYYLVLVDGEMLEVSKDYVVERTEY